MLNAKRRDAQASGKKVLVLGDGNRSFLTVTRSLGRRRLSVHVGWSAPDSSALSSRYIDTVHHIPPFGLDDDSWKQALTSILQREQFDLVIPCNDQSIIPLQTHRADLEQFAPIYLLDDVVFETVSDKSRTNELAKSLDIPVPAEIKISDPAETNTILSQFRLPVILKPRTSFTSQNLKQKRFVRKAHTPQQLSAYLKTMLADGEVLVQENFIGTGAGVELLADRGEILLAFQHVRIHEPMTGGGSTYRKSVSLHPELLNATAELIKALNYTGVAMVEFRVDFETGKWVFLEINGRFWGSLPLAVSAGADFPYYLYQLLTESRRDFPQNYKKGLYCRNFLKDLKWMALNLKAACSNPAAAIRFLKQLAAESMNLLTFRERSDTFVIDDPGPALAELRQLVELISTIGLSKLRLLLLSLPPIRKLYSNKARRALSKARTVLFVCKGNICRSPFAQYYARTVFPESVKITSCGFYPVEERPTPAEGITAADKMGIDLRSHRSIIITEELIRQAQVIFAFDAENLRNLIARYPFAGSKIFLFGLIAPCGPATIPDPYGGTIETFQAVYHTIARTLNTCGKK